jgi:hypothetical protein
MAYIWEIFLQTMEDYVNAYYYIQNGDSRFFIVKYKDVTTIATVSTEQKAWSDHGMTVIKLVKIRFCIRRVKELVDIMKGKNNYYGLYKMTQNWNLLL